MAITRTPLVDDDGSLTTGTIWNNAWLTGLYDLIDAAIDGAAAAVRSVAKGGTGAATLAAHGVVVGNGTGAVAVTGAGAAGQVLTSNGASADPTFQAVASGVASIVASTVTGAQNNYAPTLTASTLIEWAGAADAAFTGIAGGAAGWTVTIKNTGTKIATFAHASGSSSAANRFVNYATSGPTPISVGGSITYQHDGTQWQLIAHEQGAWITPPYVAGNFTASGSMTWGVDAGDVLADAYRLDGRQLTMAYVIGPTTIGGTLSSELRRLIPGGFTSAKLVVSVAGRHDNSGTAIATVLSVTAGGTTLIQYANVAASANWAASTNTTQVNGNIAFEVN